MMVIFSMLFLYVSVISVSQWSMLDPYNVLTPRVIRFLSILAAPQRLPIGRYFLYKLIAQQKDVGYKNLLRSDLVSQVRMNDDIYE